MTRNVSWPRLRRPPVWVLGPGVRATAEQAPHPRAAPAPAASDQPRGSSVLIAETPRFHWVAATPETSNSCTQIGEEPEKHTPPKHVCGRAVVLTCAKCNHTAGSRLYRSWIARFDRLQRRSATWIRWRLLSKPAIAVVASRRGRLRDHSASSPAGCASVSGIVTLPAVVAMMGVSDPNRPESGADRRRHRTAYDCSVSGESSHASLR